MGEEDYQEEHTCLSCGSVFSIKHAMYDDVKYCPFCGETDIEENEEDEE